MEKLVQVVSASTIVGIYAVVLLIAVVERLAEQRTAPHGGNWSAWKGSRQSAEPRQTNQPTHDALDIEESASQGQGDEDSDAVRARGLHRSDKDLL